MTAMTIEPGCVVTMSYDLVTEGGEIVESSDLNGPVTFMHGQGGMLPAVEQRLIGLAEGVDEVFDLAPEEGFGKVEDSPVKTIARNEFPPGTELQVGMSFAADLPGGQTIRLEIVDLRDDALDVRMVHPLAGQRLRMSVKILGVRAATAKEREAGKAMTRPPPPPSRAS
ncbi:MAG: peptidylprolyl isomerase [Nannocystaceae bacterium]